MVTRNTPLIDDIVEILLPVLVDPALLATLSNAVRPSFDENYEVGKIQHYSEQEIAAIISILGSNISKAKYQQRLERCDEMNITEKLLFLCELAGLELTKTDIENVFRRNNMKANPHQLLILGMCFDDTANQKYRMNLEVINSLMAAAVEYSISEITISQQNITKETYVIEDADGFLLDPVAVERPDVVKIPEKQAYDLDKLIEIKKKELLDLKKTVAHLQGYDRDRDGDGVRGFNPETGEITDYDDICIADKEHGMIVEDRDRDGLDREDLF